MPSLRIVKFTNRGFTVRMEGLEPPCLAALDPKSSASTNFATSALEKIGANLHNISIRTIQASVFRKWQK